MSILWTEYCRGTSRTLVEVNIVDNYRRIMLMLLLMVIIETTAFVVLIMETTVLMLMLISRGSTDSGIRSDDQLEIQVLA